MATATAADIFAELKRQIGWGARQNWWVVFLATVVLPTLTGALASVWTAAWNTGFSGISLALLLIVFAAQLIFAALVLVGQTHSPLQALVTAHDSQELLERREQELARRDRAYQMIREAFEQLNSQTCSIEYPGDEHLCESRFGDSVRPIVDKFIANIDVVFGVECPRFSFEIYLQDGVVGVDGEPSPEHPTTGLRQVLFHSTHATAEQALALTNDSPITTGVAAAVPEKFDVSQRQAVFYQHGKAKPGVYFQKVATCPIPLACSIDNSPAGLLVITSMQDMPLAPDVSAIMEFVASMIANFAYRYNACLMARRERAEQAAQSEIGGADVGARVN